jgi:hypothetical protein
MIKGIDCRAWSRIEDYNSNKYVPWPLLTLFARAAVVTTLKVVPTLRPSRGQSICRQHKLILGFRQQIPRPFDGLDVNNGLQVCDHDVLDKKGCQRAKRLAI